MEIARWIANGQQSGEIEINREIEKWRRGNRKVDSKKRTKWRDKQRDREMEKWK